MRAHRLISAITVAAVLAVMPAGLPAFADEEGESILLPGADADVKLDLPPSPLDDAFTAPDVSPATVPESNPPEDAWAESPTWDPKAHDSADDQSDSDDNSDEEVEGPVANRAPTGTTVGAPGLGSLPYFSFDTLSITADTVSRTNLGNGNLLLTASDGTLVGPGLGVRSDRFYNGLSDKVGSFGAGWSSSLSALDTGLKITSTTIDYTGSTGFTVTFTKYGSAWMPPSNFKGTLTQIAGPKYVLEFSESGEKLTFNSAGYLETDTNRNGVGTTYTYLGTGTPGRVSVVTEASGKTFSISWTTSGGYAVIASITDSASRTWTYTHNTSGQLTRVDKPGSYWEEYDYDTTGRISQLRAVGTTGTGTVKADFGYNASHQVTSIQRGPLSGSYITSVGYAYSTGSTVLTDGNSHITTYAIDAQGRVTQTTDNKGYKHDQTWAPSAYNVASTTNGYASGSGQLTTYSYDTANNATNVALPTGAAASAVYSSGTSCGSTTTGLPFLAKCTTDSNGNTKKYQYDSAGNLTLVGDTASGTTPQQYSYASGGSGCNNSYTWAGYGYNGQVCTATDGNGNVTKYNYDSAGNLTDVDPPSPLGDTLYNYDSLGRVTSVTDGNGKVTAYAYNVRDEVVTTTFDSSGTVTTGYYNNGLQKNADESGALTGPTKAFSYDATGRLIEQVVKPSATSGTYVYDFTYDAAGNMLSYEDNQFGKVTYTYWSNNQLRSLEEPGGTCPASLGNVPANAGCVYFEQDESNNEIRRHLPGNITVRTYYDNSGRVNRVRAFNEITLTNYYETNYTYTASGVDKGNVQTRTATLEEGLTAGAVTSYGYDSLNRLTSAVEKIGSTTNASWSYSYDGAGNRTQQIRAGATGATAGTYNYTYNAANELTKINSGSSWTYDATGNQTLNATTGLAATYNDRGAVTGIGSATYRSFLQGNSEAYARIETAGTTRFMQSALGQMGEVTPSGGQRQYERTPDGTIVGSRLGGGSRYYYVLDKLGSVVGMFAKDGTYYGGYTYSPYGEQRTIGTDGALTINKLRYIAGYYDDPSGMYRLGARYYDPTLGRFTQFDPSGQEPNPYTYAGCNPINTADPTGLYASVECGIATAVAISGLLGLAALAIVGAPVSGGTTLIAAYWLGAAAATLAAGAGIVGFETLC